MSSNQWCIKFLSWKTPHQNQTISTQDNVDLSNKMWLMNNIYDWIYFLSPAAIKWQCFCPRALCFVCVVQVPISIKAHFIMRQYVVWAHSAYEKQMLEALLPQKMKPILVYSMCNYTLATLLLFKYQYFTLVTNCFEAAGNRPSNYNVYPAGNCLCTQSIAFGNGYVVHNHFIVHNQ